MTALMYSQRDIVRYIRKHRFDVWTIDDMVNNTGLAPSTVNKVMRRMYVEGKLKRSEFKGLGIPHKYATPEGPDLEPYVSKKNIAVQLALFLRELINEECENGKYRGIRSHLVVQCIEDFLKLFNPFVNASNPEKKVVNYTLSTTLHDELKEIKEKSGVTPSEIARMAIYWHYFMKEQVEGED